MLSKWRGFRGLVGHEDRHGQLLVALEAVALVLRADLHYVPGVVRLHTTEPGKARRAGSSDQNTLKYTGVTSTILHTPKGAS